MNPRTEFARSDLYVTARAIARALGITPVAVHKRALYEGWQYAATADWRGARLYPIDQLTPAEQHQVLSSCGAVHSFLVDFITLTKRLFARRSK